MSETLILYQIIAGTLCFIAALTGIALTLKNGLQKELSSVLHDLPFLVVSTIFVITIAQLVSAGHASDIPEAFWVLIGGVLGKVLDFKNPFEREGAQPPVAQPVPVTQPVKGDSP